MDPVATELLLRLLVEQVAERQVTVFFSTHQLSEVEQIADYMVMVHRGRCALEGTIDDIRQRHQRVRLVLDRDVDRLPPPLDRWQRDGRFVTGVSSDSPETLAARFAPRGINVLDAQPATLKDVFLDQVAR
jgi:ABC-2 type transport system ATP-binding protein